MRNPNFIPSNDTKFNDWQKKLFAYVYSHLSDWKVQPETIVVLQTLCNLWQDKFEIADNPLTRTSVAVLEKNEARKNYEAELRKFIKAYLQYNPFVTDGDRAAMELPIHSTERKPVPVPTTYPEAEVDSSMIRCLTIHFHDSGATKKAKPQGVHGAEIRWGIMDVAPVEPIKLPNSDFDTRSPFTLEFAGEDRGKTVYFCLRWENTRGEKGRWGEIISAIIP